MLVVNAASNGVIVQPFLVLRLIDFLAVNQPDSDVPIPIDSAGRQVTATGK